MRLCLGDSFPCIGSAKAIVNSVHDIGNDAFSSRRWDDARIRCYDWSDDRLLELFADIHHPSEPAKYIGKERSIDLIYSKHLLHDPSPEIGVGGNSQPAAAAWLLDPL